MASLLWYVRRLRSMSPAEWVYRARQMRTVRGDRRRQPPGPFAETTVAAAFAAFTNGDVPWFPLEESPVINRKATLASAEALLGHRIDLFRTPIDLGAKIDWHADPRSGRRWPHLFYGDVDTRDGQTVGGVKWVWELNRCHHLVTLGKAYWLTADERFAQEACHQLSTWIEANPPYIGVNWTSALELALRIINWAWALNFMRASTHVTQALFGRILTSIRQQADYIERHLSAFSSANNHLIGEAAGLAVAGMAFPWLPSSERWRDHGLTILERELALQVHEDGVSAEQSPAYLAFVLAFNRVVWRLAELNGVAPPSIWRERLHAAALFLATTMDEAGQVPEYGDNDDAWVVRLDDTADVSRYHSVCVSAAVLMMDSTLRSTMGAWDETNHWLFGLNGAERFGALSAEARPLPSRLFPDGGYAVMRHGGLVATVDCGPLGYLRTAAHGHADALSMTLSRGATPLFVDPGTFAYQEGGPWRDYFRSTRAHNTVVVDGHDQSDMQGAFLWGRRATVTRLAWQSTPDIDLLVAEHDGYARSGVTHRRAVALHKAWQALVVVDWLLGDGVHAVELLWHGSAEARLELTADGARLQSGPQTVHLVINAGQNAHTSIVRGQSEPMQGWHSPSYGRRVQAPVLSVSQTGHLPLTLVTILSFVILTREQCDALVQNTLSWVEGNRVELTAV